MRELHLCNNLRHLLFALSDVLGRSTDAKILYLSDDTPMADSMVELVQFHFPRVELQVTTDVEQMLLFSNFPGFFPDLIRRNFRFESFQILRSTQWGLPLLGSERFVVGYIYHPGLFSSKSASFSCETVIMRESGINNYVILPVSPKKYLARAISGLPATRQIWGEEWWIDSIEVSAPDRLPELIRQKATKLTYGDLFSVLTSYQRQNLVEIFAPSLPEIADSGKKRALILTQPLEMVGLSNEVEKQKIYERIAFFLTEIGYETYVKYHPREAEYAVGPANPLHAEFPLELWPLTGLPPFDLAIALCSASLSENEKSIAQFSVQLIDAKCFSREGVRKFMDSPDEYITFGLSNVDV